MTEERILDVLYEMFQIAARVSLPFLSVSLIVGLIIAIFQAATQIHEQTITFVPKLIALLAALSILGATDLVIMQEFVRRIFTMIAGG